MADNLKHTDVGPKVSRTEWETGSAHRMDNQAEGDLVSADTPTTLSRLPAGDEGQVLKIVDGVPAWGYPAEAAIPSFGDVIDFTATDENPIVSLQVI